jgi:hypothetical protein
MGTCPSPSHAINHPTSNRKMALLSGEGGTLLSVHVYDGEDGLRNINTREVLCNCTWTIKCFPESAITITRQPAATTVNSHFNVHTHSTDIRNTASFILSFFLSFIHPLTRTTYIPDPSQLPNMPAGTLTTAQ